VLAYLLVENSSGKKSGELLKKMDNNYSAAAKGKEYLVFPKDLADAVTRFSTYKPKMASTTFKRTVKRIVWRAIRKTKFRKIALYSQVQTTRAERKESSVSDVVRWATTPATARRRSM
jgi:hypothetical protein